jgi:CheY-like chemotaxis protein
MPLPILVAGLDGRSLLLEASVLQRDGHKVEESLTARALLAKLGEDVRHLVVLGPHLPDIDLPELIRRIRTAPQTRRVSILVLVPAGEPAEFDAQSLEAGANAVLRRPLDAARLDSWLSKLLAVPRRVQARVVVAGKVVGTPRRSSGGHFVGLTVNLSVNGMLLASPVRLHGWPDVDLELDIPEPNLRLRALGRVVREAPEVGWPYLGYGVEFLYLPGESRDALVGLLAKDHPRGPEEVPRGIHSTVRRESWVFEILEPVPDEKGWLVEIHRAPRDAWRPGNGGPYYVVEGLSAAEALAQAREFVLRHG